MKIALLDAGAHSRGNHGPALQHCKMECGDELELAAVCDLDLEKAKTYGEQFGFARAYSDLEEMVAREKPDGIVAVTPIEYTEEVAGRIMRLGLPLVIEKPPGGNRVQARRLAALAALRASWAAHATAPACLASSRICATATTLPEVTVLPSVEAPRHVGAVADVH